MYDSLGYKSYRFYTITMWYSRGVLELWSRGWRGGAASWRPVVSSSVSVGAVPRAAVVYVCIWCRCALCALVLLLRLDMVPLERISFLLPLHHAVWISNESVSMGKWLAPSLQSRLCFLNSLIWRLIDTKWSLTSSLSSSSVFFFIATPLSFSSLWVIACWGPLWKDLGFLFVHSVRVFVGSWVRDFLLIPRSYCYTATQWMVPFFFFLPYPKNNFSQLKLVLWKFRVIVNESVQHWAVTETLAVTWSSMECSGWSSLEKKYGWE